MKQNRIALITCLHNRKKVSQIAFACFERLQKDFPVEMIFCYSNKENDVPHYDESDYITGIEHPNSPVSNKWNKLLEYALRSSRNYTHFLIMGDDDSISSEGLELLLSANSHHVGFRRNYYYDLLFHKAMLHEYEFHRKLIGAGRLVSREAIEQTVLRQKVIIRREFHIPNKIFHPGNNALLTIAQADYLCGYKHAVKIGEPEFIGLWPSKTNRSLDHNSEMNLVVNGFVPTSCDNERVHIVDFKSSENIWPYSILQHKCVERKKDDALWFLSEKELSIVNNF